MRRQKRLGDLLVEANMITAEQLQQALSEQKQSNRKLGDILLEKGFVSERQLIEVLEFQLGIPHVDLSRVRLDVSLLSTVPQKLATMYQAVPLYKKGSTLTVAMVDPLDYFAIDDLRMTTGFSIDPVIATRNDIQLALQRYYVIQDSVNELLEGLPVTGEQDLAEVGDEDSPMGRFVSQVISQAVRLRASDIHLDPSTNDLRVRYRIDGILRTERTVPMGMQQSISARVKILAGMNIAERRLPQDGRFQINVDYRQVDIRVATLPTVHGEKIVLRLLDYATDGWELSAMGFSPENLESFSALLQRTHGMILLTGPTGSGKTSTLYGALKYLLSEEVNIVTIEDPVEYQIDGINQVQVQPVTGLTFAVGLRALLRQDPNIVMVGEMRDQETADVAFRAALTGHLVLSTVHTNDAVRTLSRLRDMGIENYLIASALQGIVAQRLVRKVCPECQQVRAVTDEELGLFRSLQVEKQTVAYGTGCQSCGQTGYRGRMAIHEVLVVSEEIRAMIVSGASVDQILGIARSRGMSSLLEDGIKKVAQGLTTLSEVYRVTMD